jgi:hypothetical protein
LSEASPHLPLEGSLNKANIFNVQAGNADNDPDYSFSMLASPKFTAASAANYNVSSSSMTATVTTASEAATGASSFDVALSPPQSDCASPASPYSSIGVFTSELLVELEVQASASLNYSFLEPCLASPNTGTLTFSLSGSLSWTSYDSGSQTLTIKAPVSSGVHTETLTTTTANSDKLLTMFEITVYE